MNRTPTPPEFRIPLRELVSLKREIRAAEEAWKSPPCQECGAMTEDEASEKCRCSGDRDDCHGCSLWP